MIPGHGLCALAFLLLGGCGRPERHAQQDVAPAQGDPRNVTEPQAEVRCDPEAPGSGLAELHWAPAAGAEAQRVEVTLFPEAFAQGRAEASAALPAEQSSLVWRELHGQAFHFWRVLTLRKGTWEAGSVTRFEGPTCVVPSAEGTP